MMRKSKFLISILLLIILTSSSVVAQISEATGQPINKRAKSYVDEFGRPITISTLDSLINTGFYGINLSIKGENLEFSAIPLSPDQMVSPPVKEIIDRSFKHPLVGKPIHPLNATTMDGSFLDPLTTKGKIIVMNFWFVGCAPCIKEIPELNKLVKANQITNDILFIAPALDGVESLNKFLEKNPFDYQIISDARKLSDLYEIKGYPTHIILTKMELLIVASLGTRKTSIQYCSR